MPISPLGIYWAVLATIAIFVIMAICIIALMIIHNNRIRNSEAQFLFSCLINAQRIKDSENQFRILFEQAFDATLLLDGTFRIVKANEAFCRLLNCPEKLEHQTLLNFNPRAAWARLQEEFAKCLASGIGYFGEARLLNKDGKMIQVEVGATCLKINGKSFLLARFRDVSDYQKTLEELKKKNNALNVVMGHLESEKLKFKRKISETIEEQFIPALHQATMDENPSKKEFLRHLEQSLHDLASSSMIPKDALRGLTPREMEICMMIKNGDASKDIAKALNLSQMTIHKHRERIRKKLGIDNKDISLTKFLRNL